MSKFKYMARDASGKRVEDVIDAADQGAAAALLRSRGLAVLSVAEQKGGGGGGGSLFAGLFGGNKAPTPRIKNNDLVIFTRQFSTMLSAGLPVMECLDTLGDQVDDKGFRFLLATVRADLRGGQDLSGALSKYPKYFTPLYVNMIRAGEASGQLDIILQRLADYLESAEALKRKIKAALTYPVVSLALVLGITIFLVAFIVPKFQDIFTSLKVTLPLPTRMVLFTSDFMLTYWYLIVGIFIGMVVGYKAVYKTPPGRLFIDSCFLRMPVFGDLFTKVSVSRFARTFSTMLKSGVAILASLDIVGQTAGNAVIEQAVARCRESVRQGQMLADPLADCPLFPPMVVRMIAVGERSGALETLLEKVSEFYDEQVDASVESLTSLIEPLMIGFMGFLVGGIVLAIFLPIMEMQKSIGKKK